MATLEIAGVVGEPGYGGLPAPDIHVSDDGVIRIAGIRATLEYDATGAGAHVRLDLQPDDLPNRFECELCGASRQEPPGEEGVVDEGLSVVLDLGRFQKGEQIRFMTDFAERLYHRNRSPLHLVLDEADAFAPQKPRPEGARLLGAIEDLVRRGRARGIGVTLVTQRSAVLNKDVLTQAEVLVALRTTHPRDREAIEEWAKAHGTTEQLDELRESLASLPVGEGWFWSPGWLDVFKRVRIRERRTFDSSATPRVGEKPKAPRKLADVDLEQLRERMAAAIEKAKAEDPTELRRQLAALRKELEHERRAHAAHEGLQAREAAIAAAKAEPEIVEVPVISPEQLRELQSALDYLDRMGVALVADLDSRASELRELHAGFRLELHRAVTVFEKHPPRDREHPPRHRREARVTAGASSSTPPAAQSTPDPSGRSAADNLARGQRPEGTISGPQQRILNALAWFEAIGVDDPRRSPLGAVAGASPKSRSMLSSGFEKNVSTLKSFELVTYPERGHVAALPLLFPEG
jgi:hypothetical protein